MPLSVLLCEKQTLALLNIYGKCCTKLDPDPFQPPPYLYPRLSTLADIWDGSSLLTSKAENSHKSGNSSLL